MRFHEPSRTVLVEAVARSEPGQPAAVPPPGDGDPGPDVQRHDPEPEPAPQS